MLQLLKLLHHHEPLSTFNFNCNARPCNKGFEARAAHSGLFTAYGLNQHLDLPGNSDDRRAVLKSAKVDEVKAKSLGFGWSFRRRHLA